MNIVDKARQDRLIIEKAVSSLDDIDASKAVELFVGLTGNGELIKSGTRINWYGTLKRATVDLWDTEANNPDNAPTLWEDIEYRDGYRIIHETLTAGTGFPKGEVGWWKDELYESTYEGLNTWNPKQYPDGWLKVGGGKFE